MLHSARYVRARFTGVALFSLISSILATPAWADVFVYEVVGEVVEVADPLPGVDTGVAAVFSPGDSLTLQFTYDTDAPVTAELVPGVLVQYAFDGPVAFEFDTAGDVFYFGSGSSGAAAASGGQEVIFTGSMVFYQWFLSDSPLVDGAIDAPTIDAPADRTTSLANIAFFLDDGNSPLGITSVALAPFGSFDQFDMGSVEMRFETYNSSGGVIGRTNVLVELNSFDLAEEEVPSVSCEGFTGPGKKPFQELAGNRKLPLMFELFDEGGAALSDTDLAALPAIEVLFEPEGGGAVVDVSPTDNLASFVDGEWKFQLRAGDYPDDGLYLVSVVSSDGNAYEVDPSCETSFSPKKKGKKK